MSRDSGTNCVPACAATDRAHALVVVQCRTGSRRLPGKALLPLGGKPMVEFLLRRLRVALAPERYRVVLATSTSPRDAGLSTLARNQDVQTVFGPEDDVLGRYILTLDRFPADWVVRVTADNPLTCPRRLEKAVKDAEESKSDYFMYCDLPEGTAVDVFSSGLLRRLDKEAQEAAEREHINLHILNHPGFCLSRSVPSGFQGPTGISLTVDTRDEYERVKELLDHVPFEPWNIELEEALSVLAS